MTEESRSDLVQRDPSKNEDPVISAVTDLAAAPQSIAAGACRPPASISFSDDGGCGYVRPQWSLMTGSGQGFARA